MKTFSAMLLFAIFPLSTFAKDREVTVSGTCAREVSTDRGSIILTARSLEPEIKDAVNKATKTYERTLESIRKLKLENADLRTVEYSVNEDREWEKDKSVFKGYQARIGLKVSTSEVQRLGEVTAIAAREDIKDVGSLMSYLSETKLLQEQTACLKDAAEHAREKAEKLASSLGAHLGDVENINESASSGPTPPRPIPFMAHAMMARGQAAPEAPEIESGEQQVTASVQVTFSLK